MRAALLCSRGSFVCVNMLPEPIVRLFNFFRSLEFFSERLALLWCSAAGFRSKHFAKVLLFADLVNKLSVNKSDSNWQFKLTIGETLSTSMQLSSLLKVLPKSFQNLSTHLSGCTSRAAIFPVLERRSQSPISRPIWRPRKDVFGFPASVLFFTMIANSGFLFLAI